MPKNKETHMVVLASPGDLPEERELVVKVINEINKVARYDNIELELRRWEDDAFPALHKDGPQAIIDEALNIKESDVFIGLFHMRFGTPTHKSSSGTEHEIKQAIDSWEKNGSPEVKIYFKKPMVNIDDISDEDYEQYKKIKSFKKAYREKGLYCQFENNEDFEKEIKKHLEVYLNKKKRV